MSAPARPRAALPALVLAVALGVRLLAVVLSAREVADVERYRKVGVHVLDVSADPYRTRGLYPYPPVWVWAEAGSEWLARRTGAPFAVLVKLPVVAADLATVALLLAWPGAAAGAAWAYALSPVSVLVTGVHGQFDALMALAVLLAVHEAEAGRHHRSALALALAIGLKSFPVLLLPVFLLALPDARARLRYVLFALAPVALGLLPFVLVDPSGVRRELLGYGGVADLGWVGLVRGLRWAAGAGLARSDAVHWPTLVPLSKALFLAAYAALLLALARGWLRLGRLAGCLAVLLGFLGLYGGVSAQYLLWPVALGALRGGRWPRVYEGAATLALLGLYSFVVPEILWGAPPPLPPSFTGGLWVAGTAASCACALGWLGALLREARPEEAA